MSAADNISGWWLLFGIAVYAVPIGVFLHERRWLRSLVSPVLTMLRRCPFYMLVAVALFFGQMVVRGSTKTNRTNSVEIELGGGTGSVINENLNGGEQSDGGDDGLSGVVPVRSFDSITLCFTGIGISTNGITLDVFCPTNISLPENTLDVYGASALELLDWNCLASYLVSGTNNSITVLWEDIPYYSATNKPSRYFFAVGTRTDTDSDGLSDAFEHFVSDTSANNPDTDFDGLSDNEEMNLGLNPLDCDDAIQDPDSDGIPTLYEIRNGTNPNVSDYELAPKIRVGGKNGLSLRAAFESSSPYSIIEIAPGIHQGYDWTGLWFPSHPVMVTGPVAGSGQRAILRHVAGNGLAAFYMDKATNTHTFVQNFTLDMAQSPARFLAGFWCGGNTPMAGESVSATFNNVIVRLATTDAINVGWFLRHANRTKTNISGCVVNAGGASCVRGIYAIDPSPLRIENCSFINFPPDGEKASYGIQLESTEKNWGGAVSNTPVEIVNCLFDESFTNAQTLAFLEKGVSFDVNLHHSLMPAVPTNRVCGSDMVYANALTGVSGLLASNSPAICNGVPTIVSKVDANGVNRGLSPDIGAYQYIDEECFSLDSDGDGLTDYEEVYNWNTDPTLHDTDGDGLRDLFELEHGSDPLDGNSAFVSFTISVKYGDLIPGTTIYVAYGFSPTGWETNGLSHATASTSASFAAIFTCGAVYAKMFCDFNHNGVYDEGRDLILVQPVAIREEGSSVSFEIGDSDGDGQSDRFEHEHGSDPFDPKSKFVQVKVVVTNKDTGNYDVTNYLAYGFSEVGWEANGVVPFCPDLPEGHRYAFVTTNGLAYANVFRDFNHNGVYDPGIDALFLPKTQIAIIKKEVSATITIGDSDRDGIPDAQEQANGTDMLNPSNFCCNVNVEIGHAFRWTNSISMVVATNSSGMIIPVVPSVLVTNRVFSHSFPHITVTNATALYLVFFDDANSNGVREVEELFSVQYFNLTNHNTTVSMDMPKGRRTFDKDGDGIDDYWENTYGFSGSDASDALTDPDGDSLINLYEYELGTDPTVYDGTNTLISVICRSIDERIAGRTPATSIAMYNNYSANGTNFVPNANFWGADIDFSCVSHWNDYYDKGEEMRGGVLISLRHVLFARHFPVFEGYKVYFVGRDSNTYYGTIGKSRIVAPYLDKKSDILVAELTAPMTNAVTPAKLLPADFFKYLKNGKYLPAVTFDQEEHAWIGEVKDLPTYKNKLNAGTEYLWCKRSQLQNRFHFYEDTMDNDSGNPRFFVIGNQPVLLTSLYGKDTNTLESAGQFYTVYADDIQSAMNALVPGYTLQFVDLSDFQKLLEFQEGNQ